MRTQRTFLSLFFLSFLQYLSTHPHLPGFNHCALMSCPIHDRCTCYGTSLQYTTTSTGSSQFPPQTNNIFVGYEWATPLVTTSAAWYPLESVIIQPPTSHSGQEILQPDRYSLGSRHEALSLHNAYHREPRPDENGEQKLAHPTRGQVHFPVSNTSSLAYAKLACSTTLVPHTVHPGSFSNGHAQQSL